MFEILVFFFVLATAYFLLEQRGNKRLPPGPLPLPLLGNALQLGRYPYLRFIEWSHKYGPIFRIRIGKMSVVVLNNYNHMKEMFGDPRCVGRMLGNPVMYEFSQGNNGIVMAEGDVWTAQRRFTLRTLHQLGMSKVTMEAIVLDEAHATVQWLGTKCGQSISGSRLFNSSVVNSLWRLMSGERCDWEQGRSRVVDVIEHFMSIADIVCSNGLIFMPILKDIAPEYFYWNAYKDSIKRALEMFTESIEIHKATFDPNNLRDYIDIYLNEIKNETDPASSFYKESGETQLRTQLFDLFMAGSETSATLLSWGLLYLGAHPEKQAALQKEIDSIVGTRSPFLTDRTRMPYTEAIINELLRVGPILPLGIPHRLIDDMEFHGYQLPKGTHIIPNIFGALHDPEVWDEPYSFKPERFLTDNGTKVVRHPALITFSEGRRKCPGEGIGRDTAFIYLVSIFQRFELKLEDEFMKNPRFEATEGHIVRPKEFKVIFNRRVS